MFVPLQQWKTKVMKNEGQEAKQRTLFEHTPFFFFFRAGGGQWWLVAQLISVLSFIINFTRC